MATQNAIGGGTFFYYPQLTGVSYPRVWGSNLATGDNDLYTVPTGKKTIIHSGGMRAYNPSAGSITYYSEIKVSGSYYRTGAGVTLTTGVGENTSGLVQGILLNAGESFSVNTATTAGLNILYSAIEFDASNPVYGGRSLALASGDNTILTVSAGKTVFFPFNLTAASHLQIGIFNASGASRNYVLYNVPSGGSAGTTNQIFPTTAVADVTASSFTHGGTMNAGDFLVLNSNDGTAGQVTWCIYFER